MGWEIHIKFSNFSFSFSLLSFSLSTFLLGFLISCSDLVCQLRVSILIGIKSSLFSLLVIFISKISFNLISCYILVGIFSSQLGKIWGIYSKSRDFIWFVYLLHSQVTMSNKRKILKHMDRSEYHIKNLVFLPPDPWKHGFGRKTLLRNPSCCIYLIFSSAVSLAWGEMQF